MHKAYIYIDSTDESGQATVAAGVTEVIAAYGVRVLVRATDEELAALEAAGLRVELADEMDSLPFPGLSVETAFPPAVESRVEPEGLTKAKSKTKANPKTKRKGPKKQAAAGSAAVPQDIDAEPAYWLVQFVGPPLPEWVESVRGAGAEITGPIPPNMILVRMTTTQADAVRALDRVQWVGSYQPEYKVYPDISAPAPPPDTRARSKQPSAKRASRAADTPVPPERVAVTVVLFDANARASVVAEIEARDGIVQQADIDTIICDLPPSAIPDIAALTVVAKIFPYTPPMPEMQRARPITKVQTVFDTHGLDGEGEIVCVADTGLDIGGPGLHSDFLQLGVARQSRVVPYALGGPSWSDTHGHGTHVAGIAVGNGSTYGRVGRPASGVAYKAQLVMQALGTGLPGIPPNLNDLFETPYATDGARVHNNSWSSTALNNMGRYFPHAHQIDEFVWRNPDMVIVFAAANHASDGPRSGAPLAPDPLGNVADGVVDFASISPEATCRNGITVGGSENFRPNNWGASPATTWSAIGLLGQLGGVFATGTLSADPVASDDNHLMAISGRGPTVIPGPPPLAAGVWQGDRIKPDVVAPGSSILSCRSQSMPGGPLGTTWGANPPAGYRFTGGTSMATPHVSGMCALIRQYLRKMYPPSSDPNALVVYDPNNPLRRRRRPSAALIKALLVHGAGKITGLTPLSEGTVPNNHQGWGRVDLRRTLFSHLKSSLAFQDNTWLPRRTIFIDDPDRTLNGTTHANHAVRVRVSDASIPLRATLVWTDYPGPVAPNNGELINQLQLRVAGGGTTTNFSLPAGIQPTAPAPLQALKNNVQQIDIAAPVAGDYVVTVIANNIGSVATANVEQDFALVISGAISHSDHRQPGTMKAMPDLAFVGVERATDTGPEIHDGLAPSPQAPSGNPGSPDIWVSRERNSDPGQAATRLEFGTTYYVYVRVRNLGFAPATGAQINVYWANMASPMAYPADWKTEGFKVNGVAGNQQTVNLPARAKSGGAWRDSVFIAGPFEWTLPRGVERVALFVRAEHPDDPIVNEGDPRWDNNIARRDMPLIQDNTTQVQGQPSCWDRFIFWLISGFSSPRDIELRAALAYQDIRDGQVKPLPPGVEVEVWDYDPVSGDDRLAQGRTTLSVNAAGQPTSVLHLTFSTYESGEGSPDIYLKVLKPTGPDFAEFVNNSFFAAGAASWTSKDQTTATGGFFLEDYGSNRIGIPEAVVAVIRPRGIQVRAAFEYFSATSNQFEKLRGGIEVKVKDSKASAPQPLLGRATTNDNGEITTVIPRRGDYRPSLYFEIEKTVATERDFLGIDYFRAQNLWDSRTHQGEVVAADNSVTSISGHFQNWAQDTLVAANQRLRFRLESPGILMHLHFQYYDHEAPAGYVDLPRDTEVEAWENVAGAASPLVVGTVGANGRVELSVPKGNRPHLDLLVRVVMRRRLAGDVTVEVSKAGNVIRWPKDHPAAAGSPGTFNAVIDHVATAAAPQLLQIGAAGDSGGVADNTDVHAAPFILKVIGQIHDWLRTRSGGTWSGIHELRVELFNGSNTEGSRFTRPDGVIELGNTIRLNTTAHGLPLLDHRSRNVIAHLYGHMVLERLYADPFRTAPTVPNHHLYNSAVEQPNQQRRVLAEGWADYIANLHLATPTRPDSTLGQTGWRGTNSTGANNNGADSSGEIVPVAVANALWRLEQDIIGQGNSNNINNEVNRRRFQALIYNAIQSLSPFDENRQGAFDLYSAIQRANLATADLISPYDIAFIRREVRRIFAANGMIFTRGRFTRAAARVSPAGAVPLVHRFEVGPADRARLNVAQMGRITAYRLQARPVPGPIIGPPPPPNFIDLEPVVLVPIANVTQIVTIDVNFTAARESGLLTSAGAYNMRVAARDEFEAWDTFADNFTGNTAGTTRVTDNDTWQRVRLGSILAAPIVVP